MLQRVQPCSDCTLTDCRFDVETNRMVVNEEELTFGCGEGGKLIGCTFCFNAAHAECCGMGDQRTSAPRGDWACPACVDHTRSQLAGGSDDSEESAEGHHGDDDSDGGAEPVADVTGISVEWIRNPSTTVRMLKTELKRLGLKVSGNKKVLVQRLLEYNNTE